MEFRPERSPLVPPGGADLHERDMTATFSADLTLSDVQTQLGAIGQWLPIDGGASWTLGRLVLSNSTGPLRLGYGAWRDLLLGFQFRNGRGELITAGGRTVKNVAGYDLTKFMVGQGGIFGEPVTVTTRTYRRPIGAIIARFELDVWWINRLLPTARRPQWIAHTRQGTWCGYLGDQRTIAYYADALRELTPLELRERSPEEDMAHRAELWQWAGIDGSFRAAVPPVKVLEFVRAALLNEWSADGAFGIVIGLAEPGQQDAIRQAAKAVGGSVYFVEDGQAKIELDAGRRALLGRLKDAFDPQGNLTALP